MPYGETNVRRVDPSDRDRIGVILAGDHQLAVLVE
jgi:hypothetical protein